MSEEARGRALSSLYDEVARHCSLSPFNYVGNELGDERPGLAHSTQASWTAVLTYMTRRAMGRWRVTAAEDVSLGDSKGGQGLSSGG